MDCLCEKGKFKQSLKNIYKVCEIEIVKENLQDRAFVIFELKRNFLTESLWKREWPNI